MSKNGRNYLYAKPSNLEAVMYNEIGSSMLIIVLSAPPGSGKSTVMIKIAIDHFSNGKEGLLIVVERHEDGQRISDEINTKVGRPVSAVYYGYDEKYCVHRDREKIWSNRNKGTRFCSKKCEIQYGLDTDKCKCSRGKVVVCQDKPILIISHASLLIMLKNTKYREKILKYNGNKEQCRKCVFIDEAPAIDAIYSVDRKEFYTRKKTVDKSENKRLKTLYRIVSQAFRTPKYKIGKIRIDMNWEDIGKEIWLNDEVDKKVWQVCKKGWENAFVSELVEGKSKGIARPYPKRISVAVSYYKELIGFADAVIVLDGTSHINPTYVLYDFQTKVLKRKQPVCRIHLMDKVRYKGTIRRDPDGVCKEVMAEIGNVYDREKGKMFVVTEKDFEEQYLTAQVPEYARVVHYNALRGRNDLREYKVVYFTHIMQKPSDCYLGQVLASKKFKIKSYGIEEKGKQFIDKKIEMVKAMSIAEGIIQDIYRSIIRNNLEGVDVYIGIKNKLVIGCLLMAQKNIEFELAGF